MTIDAVDYTTKIPNNVNLAEDRQVLRALESWHPGYIDWWKDMGPEGFQDALVYLRTAVSVDPKGWAKFDYVKMPDYRWGILLAPQEEGRTIPFGRHLGELVRPFAGDKAVDHGKDDLRRFHVGDRQRR